MRISLVIKYFLCVFLKLRERKTALVQADLPVDLYVIVSKVFYFHISGHKIIPIPLALFFLCLCWSFNCENVLSFTA